MKARAKERAVKIALVSASLVAAFVLAEAAYGLFILALRGDSRAVVSLDDELGWRPTENLKFRKTLKDAGGQEYTVRYASSRYGFRMYSDVKSPKKRLLFIGDSYTWDREVSNSKTYYAILAERLPVEVFAFGSGGYGTLQEFMILDKFVDSIHPDMVILQFSWNDFINNTLEMDSASSCPNPLPRPHLTEEGTVQYAYPCRFGLLRDIIYRYSRLLSWVTGKLDQMASVYIRHHYIEEEISELGEKHPAFARSVQVTDILFRKMRQRIPHTPILAFSSKEPEPYYTAFKRISQQNGMEVVEGLGTASKDAENRGIVVKAADRSHWNEAGHEICAEILTAPLAKRLKIGNAAAVSHK